MSKFLSLLKLRNFINAGDSALEVGINTEATENPRFRIDAGGTHNWGAGGATATDTNLYRSAANTLKTDDALIATGGLTVKTTEIDTASATTGQALVYNGTKFAPTTVNSSGITVSDTAPVAPQPGALWFEADTGLVYVYYDSYWVEIGSGSSYDPVTNTIQAKGDLVVGTASQALSRQAVGSDKQRLIANSSTTTGVSWADDSTNTVIDTKGDLLVGATNDVVAKLPVGTDSQMLVADSTATNGVAWQSLPWNLPWGKVGNLRTTTAGTTLPTTAESRGLGPTSTVAFTAVANRYYRITYHEPHLTISSSSFGTSITMRIRQTTITGTVLQENVVTTPTTNTMSISQTLTYIGTFSAGSQTIIATLQSNSSTGCAASRSATKPGQLIVEDIGPA